MQSRTFQRRVLHPRINPDEAIFRCNSYAGLVPLSQESLFLISLRHLRVLSAKVLQEEGRG